MRIRTQNLLAILPLFLFLALVSSALMVHAERGELLWGIREEAGALAVATAEFIDGDRYRDLAARGIAPRAMAELRMPLERILARHQAKRIFGLTADGQRVVFSVGGARRDPTPWPPPPRNGRGGTGKHPGSGSGLPKSGEGMGAVSSSPADLPGFRAAMAADRCFVTEVRQAPRQRAALVAFAPIHDARGKRMGVLGVETAAGGFAAATRHLWWRSAAITGAVLVLGFMVVTALSGIVTREIEALTGAAVEVREGKLDCPIQSGRVQEVADLGNTFNTMTDVLRDVLTRTRRSLIEGEQFRTGADLARFYIERCWAPLRIDLGGVRVAARRVDAGCPGRTSPSGGSPAETGAFYAAFEAPSGACCAAVGRVKPRGELESAIDASAAASFLRREMAEHEPESALARLGERFAIERLECLCWRAGDAMAEFWRMTASLPPTRRPVPLRPHAAHALHPFEGRAAEIIDRYARAFPDLSPEELLEDLAAALPPGTSGSLIVVKAVMSDE